MYTRTYITMMRFANRKKKKYKYEYFKYKNNVQNFSLNDVCRWL